MIQSMPIMIKIVGSNYYSTCSEHKLLLIKSVSDLGQVSSFLWLLTFPPHTKKPHRCDTHMKNIYKNPLDVLFYYLEILQFRVHTSFISY